MTATASSSTLGAMLLVDSLDLPFVMVGIPSRELLPLVVHGGTGAVRLTGSIEVIFSIGDGQRYALLRKRAI